MASPIQSILDQVQAYLPQADLGRIQRAYEFAERYHSGQLRFSGEPYILHPVAATQILLALQPDEDSICACLLHDVIEDTEADYSVLKKEFGKSVADLAAGMEKLGKVRYRGEERQIENLRKLFVSMAADLRVIFIKLADRLHNMQTLEHVRPDKQIRIARETLEVYAPIASRLGIYPFKKKLEDLAFRYLEPEAYAQIASELEGSGTDREKFIQSAQARVREIFSTSGIVVEITGRTKHLYSIWKKLNKKGYPSVGEIYDLFALRILTNSQQDCYTALGIVHQHFTPLNQRFKDFIAMPKANGYQSLHTTVTGLHPRQPTEIQIRTHEMHALAERGAAAHWQYSEHKTSIKVDEKQFSWVRVLVELQEKMQDNDEFVESLAIDTLTDRIFTLTPAGRVIDLPAGATPIDFAYAVHTEIGHQCIGAKVNGKIVQLNYALKNGEVVEILTKKESTPNRFWLSFAKTSSAKSKIKTYFNALDREDNLIAGKELLNRQLTRLGKPKLDQEYSILRNYKKQNLDPKARENLVERVGNGSIAASAVVHDLFEFGELVDSKLRKAPPAASDAKLSESTEVVVAGETGLATSIAKCCEPRPGDEIVALATPKKMTIHKVSCRQLTRTNPERQLAAVFRADYVAPRLVSITLGSVNRVGLLRDIAGVIAELGINIADIALKKSTKYAIEHEFTLEVSDLNQLETVLERLEQIDGVSEVTRSGESCPLPRRKAGSKKTK